MFDLFDPTAGGLARRDAFETGLARRDGFEPGLAVSEGGMYSPR